MKCTPTFTILSLLLLLLLLLLLPASLPCCSQDQGPQARPCSAGAAGRPEFCGWAVAGGQQTHCLCPGEQGPCGGDKKVTCTSHGLVTPPPTTTHTPPPPPRAPFITHPLPPSHPSLPVTPSWPTPCTLSPHRPLHPLRACPATSRRPSPSTAPRVCRPTRCCGSLCPPALPAPRCPAPVPRVRNCTRCSPPPPRNTQHRAPRALLISWWLGVS